MYRIKFWVQTQIDFFLGLGMGPDPRPKPKAQVFFSLMSDWESR